MWKWCSGYWRYKSGHLQRFCDFCHTSTIVKLRVCPRLSVAFVVVGLCGLVFLGGLLYLFRGSDTWWVAVMWWVCYSGLCFFFCCFWFFWCVVDGCGYGWFVLCVSWFGLGIGFLVSVAFVLVSRGTVGHVCFVGGFRFCCRCWFAPSRLGGRRLRWACMFLGECVVFLVFYSVGHCLSIHVACFFCGAFFFLRVRFPLPASVHLAPLFSFFLCRLDSFTLLLLGVIFLPRTVCFTGLIFSFLPWLLLPCFVAVVPWSSLWLFHLARLTPPWLNALFWLLLCFLALGFVFSGDDVRGLVFLRPCRLHSFFPLVGVHGSSFGASRPPRGLTVGLVSTSLLLYFALYRSLSSAWSDLSSSAASDLVAPSSFYLFHALSIGPGVLQGAALFLPHGQWYVIPSFSGYCSYDRSVMWGSVFTEYWPRAQRLRNVMLLITFEFSSLFNHLNPTNLLRRHLCFL